MKIYSASASCVPAPSLITRPSAGLPPCAIRLVNVAHGLIGATDQEGGRKPAKLLQCVFLSSDGRLFTLNVPFHLALR